MKLYAGFTDGNFEYAVWAGSKRDLLNIVSQFWYHPHSVVKQMVEQKNVELKTELEKRTVVYRRFLDNESVWQEWRNFK